MKKIIVSIIALASVAMLNAQTGLGLQAGVNFSNITGKNMDNFKMKTGFQVGANYNIPVADQFVVQPGLNYLQNGYKISTSGGKSTTTYSYLQLPVLFQFRPELANGSKVIVGAGPYAAYGIGKIKDKWDEGSVSVSWDDYGQEKFDAGAKIVIGYELANGISLNLNGDLGLMKLNKESVNKPRNTAFGVTVGYRFR